MLSGLSDNHSFQRGSVLKQAKASTAAVAWPRCQRYLAIMDDVDRAMIARSYRRTGVRHGEAPRRLDVSEGTVRRRVAKLRHDGIIRVVAVAAPQVTVRHDARG